MGDVSVGIHPPSDIIGIFNFCKISDVRNAGFVLFFLLVGYK